MPWQRRWLDVVYEIDPETGRLAYSEDRCTVPRQSGKTTVSLPRVVHRALACGNAALPFGASPQNIRYGAQTGSDARKKWQDDWLPMLRQSRFRSFYRERLANGHEALLFANGSMQSLVANTKESGHGGTVDLGLLDEVFAYKDARMEQALLPAMITRPQPQFGLVSTAGTPKASPYLYGKVLSGRQLAERQVEDESLRRGVCYVEYSAPDGADPMDPHTWWECMPALGFTVQELAVRSAMETMLADPKLGLSEFRRAYLNQWVLAMGDPIVPLDHWRTLARVDAPRPPWVVLGLAVGPQDSSAAVVAAGEDLVGIQCAVVEHGEGIDWLLPPPSDSGCPQEGLGEPTGALARLVQKYERPYVIVDEKQCAHLLPEIERVVGFDRVIRRQAGRMPACSAFWLRLCKTSRLLHRDEPELTVALAAAERRLTLDSGWAFSASKSGADISPLQAQVLAASYWLGAYGSEED